MAVPEFLRNARTMRVYTKARSILIHTRQIVYSEKNIPKRVRYPYAVKLDHEAEEMFSCVGKANCIHPTTAADYQLRREYLIQAKVHAQALAEIRKKVNAMGLALNRKTHVYPLRNGIKFLRWRYILTDTGKIVRRMDKRSISRERRKLKKIGAKVGSGELPERKLAESYQSWRAHARQGNTKSIVFNMDRLFCGILQAARRERRQNEQNHRAGIGKRESTAACAECGT